jgi:hypothetical protein
VGAAQKKLFRKGKNKAGFIPLYLAKVSKVQNEVGKSRDRSQRNTINVDDFSDGDVPY